MKKFSVIFAILFSNYLIAQNLQSTYQQLASVNKEWELQKDVSATLKNAEAKPLSEQQLEQFHLQQTELLLRSRDISHLSPALKKQRAKNLDILYSYWQKGLFPVNDMHEGRQPYFIDKYNTYCAVGYLIQQTGADDVAKEIAATQNYSYLEDITHPKLMNWVAHSGLSLEELALIQLPYFGQAPCYATEMHYNNTGTDVNEYIEVRQTFTNIVPATMLSFDKILFYDQVGTLYKTLDISQMQTQGSGGAGFLYYYGFPANENFADIGYFEIVNSVPTNKVLAKYSYNQNTVTHERLINDFYEAANPTYISYNFAVGENESTLVGNSLSFCGSFPPTTSTGLGNWRLLSSTSSQAIVNACMLVPIVLSKFEYSLQNNNVKLFWETANEYKSDYYEIERSIDATKFEKIGLVKAAGNSANTSQYVFVDNEPNYLNHYRLKQVELDGKITYSKILFVKVPQANPVKVMVNPVVNNIQLQLGFEVSKVKIIDIFDLMGRKVKSFSGLINFQNLDVATISSGKYILELHTSDSQMYSTQFVKIN